MNVVGRLEFELAYSDVASNVLTTTPKDMPLPRYCSDFDCIKLVLKL